MVPRAGEGKARERRREEAENLAAEAWADRPSALSQGRGETAARPKFQARRGEEIYNGRVSRNYWGL